MRNITREKEKNLSQERECCPWLYYIHTGESIDEENKYTLC